jgi:hypothetical protein
MNSENGGVLFTAFDRGARLVRQFNVKDGSISSIRHHDDNFS